MSTHTPTARRSPGRPPGENAVYCAHFLRALGNIIRRRRVMAGLCLDEFAAAANLSRGQLAKIETGYQAPNKDAFAAICGLLDMAPVQLFMQSMAEVETRLALAVAPTLLTRELTPPTAAHRPRLPSHS